MNQLSWNQIGRLASLTVFCSVVLLSGCAQTENAPNIHVKNEGASIQSFKRGDESIFPSEADPNLVDVRNLVEPTEWKIYAIRLTKVNEAMKTKFFFQHAARTVGVLKEDDAQDIKVDWGIAADYTAGASDIEQSLNVPYLIKTGKGTDPNAKPKSLETANRHFFWVHTSNDAKWQFRLSGKESPAGVRFYEIFDENNQDKTNPKIYRKTNLRAHDKPREDSMITSRGTVTANSESITFICELQKPDQTQTIVQITYRKK